MNIFGWRFTKIWTQQRSDTRNYTDITVLKSQFSCSTEKKHPKQFAKSLFWKLVNLKLRKDRAYECSIHCFVLGEDFLIRIIEHQIISACSLRSSEYNFFPYNFGDMPFRNFAYSSEISIPNHSQPTQVIYCIILQSPVIYWEIDIKNMVRFCKILVQNTLLANKSSTIHFPKFWRKRNEMRNFLHFLLFFLVEMTSKRRCTF